MPKTNKSPPRAPVNPGQQLLFKPQILELLGVSYTTVWGWMAKDLFPKPIELGPKNGRTTKIAWFADEIYAWLADRPRRKIGGLAEHRAAQERQRGVAP